MEQEQCNSSFKEKLLQYFKDEGRDEEFMKAREDLKALRGAEALK